MGQKQMMTVEDIQAILKERAPGMDIVVRIRRRYVGGIWLWDGNEHVHNSLQKMMQVMGLRGCLDKINAMRWEDIP
jgi:hypothetical protein